MEELARNVHLLRNNLQIKGMHELMTHLLSFCGQNLSMKTEQKDTLVSQLADMVRRRESDIIDTALYHFVHYSHCTSNRPKKDIANLLYRLVKKH